MKNISAQICIEQRGLSWEEDESLFCEKYGEPKSIVHNLVKAYVSSRGDWKAGRSSKATSLLGEASPNKFRQHTGHKLRDDIKYMYYLLLKNKHSGGKFESPVWMMEVFETTRQYIDAEIIQWEQSDGSAFASSGYEKTLCTVNLRDYKSLLNNHCLKVVGGVEIFRQANKTRVVIDSDLADLIEGDYIIDGEYLGDDYL